MEDSGSGEVMTYLWYCDGASHPLKAKKNGLLQYLTLHDYTPPHPLPAQKKKTL